MENQQTLKRMYIEMIKNDNTIENADELIEQLNHEEKIDNLTLYKLYKNAIKKGCTQKIAFNNNEDLENLTNFIEYTNLYNSKEEWITKNGNLEEYEKMINKTKTKEVGPDFINALEIFDMIINPFAYITIENMDYLNDNNIEVYGTINKKDNKYSLTIKHNILKETIRTKIKHRKNDMQYSYSCNSINHFLKIKHNINKKTECLTETITIYIVNKKLNISSKLFIDLYNDECYINPGNILLGKYQKKVLIYNKIVDAIDKMRKIEDKYTKIKK